MPCECANWCRVDMTPEEFKSEHHKECEIYKNEIQVLKVSFGGAFYCDSEIESGMMSVADMMTDEDIYTVQIITMKQGEYDSLPEFTGF